MTNYNNITITQIEQQIEQQFAPKYLKIEDISHYHEGHGNYIAGKITHISIKIFSPELKDMRAIDAHRAINKVLAPFVAQGLHAYKITILREPVKDNE